MDRLTGKLMVVTSVTKIELGPGVKPGGPLREARGLDKEGRVGRGLRRRVSHPSASSWENQQYVCSGQKGLHMRSRG